LPPSFRRGSAASLSPTQRCRASLIHSPDSGSFRTEIGKAARRSIPIRRRANLPLKRIRFDLIFYEAGSFPQRLLVWLDDQWNVVPAVRTSLVGVDLNVWMRTVADLRRRFAAGAKVNEHIVHDAIRAISEIADDSVCRTAIAGLRPDAAEINRTEESLTLGFDIVADNAGEQKSADGIIGTEFPATPASALSPPSVTAPANSAKDSANASTKPASVTLPPAPRNLPSLED
jgi:hypothetical protein